MHISTAQDPRSFLPMIKQVMHKTRFLVIWRDLPFPNPDAKFFLYGSHKSEADALSEAIADHPVGELVQRIEYLPPQEIERLAALKHDPIGETFKDLGLIKK